MGVSVVPMTSSEVGMSDLQNSTEEESSEIDESFVLQNMGYLDKGSVEEENDAYTTELARSFEPETIDFEPEPIFETEIVYDEDYYQGTDAIEHATELPSYLMEETSFTEGSFYDVDQ